MTQSHDPSYVVTNDATRKLIQPPFVPHSMVINNQTNQAVTVIDGKAGSWLALPGEVRKVNLYDADTNYIAATSAVAVGTCRIIFSLDPVDDSGTTPAVTAAPDDVLIYTNPTSGPATKVIDIPAKVREITIYQEPGNNIGSIFVTGVQTGNVYRAIYSRYLGGTRYRFRLDLYRGLDTQLSISLGSSGSNGYTVYGHFQPGQLGIINPSGAMVVQIEPADGNFATYTTLLDGSGAIQGNSINPLFVSSRPDRSPRTLLAATAFTGAGTIYHGPFDMQGATGGVFVVYVSVGAVNVNVNISPDSSYFEMATWGPQACPAFMSFDIAPGATGAGGVTVRQGGALKGQEYVYVNRTGNCTYSITFWPSTFA